MTQYHTIKLSGDKVDVRSSKTRAYQACLVCTASERMVTLYAARLLKAQQELVLKEQELEQAIAIYGSVETCKETVKREGESHYPASDPITKEVMATSRLYGEALHKRVEQVMSERGLPPNPYRPNSSYTVVNLAQVVDGLKSQVEAYSADPGVGSQFVLSWHLSVANARTASSGQMARHYMNEGWDVQLRQDFEVSDKRPSKKAAKKA